MMEGQAKKEQSQVAHQQAAMGDAVDRLYAQISKLEECLSSVLRVVSEAKCAEEPGPKQDLVPLADRIRDYVTRVECASDALRDVMTRLEL